MTSSDQFSRGEDAPLAAGMDGALRAFLENMGGIWEDIGLTPEERGERVSQLVHFFQEVFRNVEDKEAMVRKRMQGDVEVAEARHAELLAEMQVQSDLDNKAQQPLRARLALVREAIGRLEAHQVKIRAEQKHAELRKALDRVTSLRAMIKDHSEVLGGFELVIGTAAGRGRVRSQIVLPARDQSRELLERHRIYERTLSEPVPNVSEREGLADSQKYVISDKYVAYLESLEQALCSERESRRQELQRFRPGQANGFGEGQEGPGSLSVDRLEEMAASANAPGSSVSTSVGKADASGRTLEEKRLRILELWWEMRTPIMERNMCSFLVTPPSDASPDIMRQHDAITDSLEARLKDVAPCMRLLARLEALLESRREYQELLDNPRPRGMGRDPGRTQREEKLRQAVLRELPQVQKKLRARLKEFESKHGQPLIMAVAPEEDSAGPPIPAVGEDYLVSVVLDFAESHMALPTTAEAVDLSIHPMQAENAGQRCQRAIQRILAPKMARPVAAVDPSSSRANAAVRGAPQSSMGRNSRSLSPTRKLEPAARGAPRRASPPPAAGAARVARAVGASNDPGHMGSGIRGMSPPSRAQSGTIQPTQSRQARTPQQDSVAASAAAQSMPATVQPSGRAVNAPGRRPVASRIGFRSGTEDGDETPLSTPRTLGRAAADRGRRRSGAVEGRLGAEIAQPTENSQADVEGGFNAQWTHVKREVDMNLAKVMATLEQIHLPSRSEGSRGAGEGA
mmetsp:Transcript_114535/g.262815  ORF Transcript_114535/g.262815 Transcript_114535/m.262815 type:complete len:742 (+) Transcript_114535:18-2243(+)